MKGIIDTKLYISEWLGNYTKVQMKGFIDT